METPHRDELLASTEANKAAVRRLVERAPRSSGIIRRNVPVAGFEPTLTLR
jgi:hypothetical protein